jgi:hypothetical protein
MIAYLPADVYMIAALPKLSHPGYSFFQVLLIMHCCITKKSHRPVPPASNTNFNPGHHFYRSDGLLEIKHP